MNKLIIVGTFGLALTGCVGTAVSPHVAVRDDAEGVMGMHYEYPNVRIDKLFGLNDTVLADTNLFPGVSSGFHHYNLSLEKNDNGFTDCTAHLEYDAKTDGLKLQYVEIKRTLNPGADDAELLKEFRKAVGWLNDTFGTDMEVEKLTDLQAMLDRPGCDRDRCSLLLCVSSVYADLADGQELHVAAHDAVFMKRGGEYVEMFPASIEITFRVGDNHCVRRPKIKRAVQQEDGKFVEVSDEPTAVGAVQGISIGMDISEKLSKAVKMREQERPRMARPVGGKKGP